MIRRFVAWIRTGYPNPAPEHCYLIALCGPPTPTR